MLKQSEDANEKFLTPQKFEQIIDRMVYDSDYSYVEAILEYCEDHSLDPEETVRYINSNLKKKIEVEAVMNNYLPKKSSLELVME